jgi:hypothetical protein
MNLEPPKPEKRSCRFCIYMQRTKVPNLVECSIRKFRRIYFNFPYGAGEYNNPQIAEFMEYARDCFIYKEK